MLASFYNKTGPAAIVLNIGEMPTPEPDEGEVLVQIRASGINPTDVKHRAGWNGLKMQHPVVIPHTDGAGQIVDVGAGVDRGRIGQRVWLWNAQGGYGEAGRAFGTAAQYIAIKAEQAVPLADQLSFSEGACLGVPAMTAWWAIHASGSVKGKTVLVQGAAGAVGHCAVQIAVAGGATVIGTISNRAAAYHAKLAGAHHLIDRKKEDVVLRVSEFTDGRGADLIVEVDLAENFRTDIAALANNGIIASYSCSSDPEPVLPYYALANLGATINFVQGFRIPEVQRREGEKALSELANSDKLKIAVSEPYEIEEIADAHVRVEQGGLGNTVLTFPETAR